MMGSLGTVELVLVLAMMGATPFVVRAVWRRISR